MIESSPPRFVYELPLGTAEDRAPSSDSDGTSASLQDVLLVENVLWFVRLRWIAIAALLAFGAAGLIAHDFFLVLGLRSPLGWPFVIATLLLLMNLAYLGHAKLMLQMPPHRGATWNLWTQIILDLLALTVVVQFLGSLETPAPFIYLAHIVLACIFFSRRQSRIVLGVAAALYALSVGLERLQLFRAPGIYRDSALPQILTRHPTFPWFTMLAALAIFFVVWLLASHLSGLVRAQEAELVKANRRLITVQREKARHMLRTTHELKAPFAAIAANAQLLLKGQCGVLPEGAVEVIQKIGLRCRRLALEIQEMLQLANLQSEDEQPPPVRLDLPDLLRWAIARVGAAAQQRRVIVEEVLMPAEVVAVEDHLKMLLTNVISNAVIYSAEGGIVRVRCDGPPCAGAVVTVEDEGIGIPEAKLPRIFDDYYRTEEAVRYNRDSTGLGLAIARRVAVSHGIRVQVESAPGRGTRFTLRFPASA